MLQANQVTQPLHGQPRQQKVPEFTAAVQNRRVIDNVIVNMLPVGVRSNQKSILAFCKAHRQLKGLPNLICDHITFLPASVHKVVLPLGEHKFFICRQGATSIAAYQLALLGLVRVLDIAGVIVQTRPDGLDLVFVQRNQPCCCQQHHPLLQRKKAARRRHIIHQD